MTTKGKLLFSHEPEDDSYTMIERSPWRASRLLKSSVEASSSTPTRPSTMPPLPTPSSC